VGVYQLNQLSDKLEDAVFCVNRSFSGETKESDNLKFHYEVN